ncbi:MAG: 50S ribosomal protein L9 [Lachnospiraceae bacterium]|nr:50S ribosomal protein L9 [Lachnospiraceae bacterium]MBQ9233641.1 50S ribosomal protein L9 [Lachnospiraceae bacterium]
MKVILLQDVKSLGKKDEIVEVSDGYARNFVLPKKVGVEANAKNLNELKLKKAHEDKVAAEKLAEAKALAEKMKDESITVSLKVGEGGKTFGSISSKEIAEEMKKQLGYDIDKKKIVLKEAIKSVGTHIVDIKLHTKVTAHISVKVAEGK